MTSVPGNAGLVSRAGLFSRSLAVYAKDVQLELRTKYAINAILMFSITTLAVVSFSLGRADLPPDLLAALFWIVMFFSAVSGLAQVFVREEEAQTALALRLTADPESVYIGKLLFNFSLLSLMALIITPIFFVFTGAPTENLPLFILIVALGVVGLCGATTLVAAIISRASVKGALFAVLSFPILMPLLMVLVKASEEALRNGTIGDVSDHLKVLISIPVIMITLSVMVFKFVWND